MRASTSLRVPLKGPVPSILSETSAAANFNDSARDRDPHGVVGGNPAKLLKVFE